ncbi:MAG: methyl-accepting chemotaxis protein [Lautropia sp.]
MKQWFGNLPLRAKFVLIGLAFVAAMVPPEAITLTNAYQTIASVKQERLGLPSLDALMRLVRETQKHRGLTAMALGGDAKAGAGRAAQAAQVADALTAAEAAAAAAGYDGQREMLQRYARDWTALTAQLAAAKIGADASFERHTALVGVAIAALDAIAAESGLSLDSEASGFYLVQATTDRMPRLTELLAQVRGEGAGLLARIAAGGASAQDPARHRLQTLARVLADQSRATHASLRHAIAADPALAAALTGKVDASFRSTQAVLETIAGELVGKERPTLAAGTFFAELTGIIDANADISRTALASLATTLDARIRSGTIEFWRSLSMTLLLTAFAVLGLVSAARQVTGSIDAAVAAATAMGAGDLTHPVPAGSGDETGRLLRALSTLQGALSTVVGAVRSNAENVATASAQISSGNTDLAKRTESQASALEQTSSAMEELGSTVQQNAASAMQANQLAIAASTVATKGGDVMREVVQTMRTIHDGSRRIADITATIDGIAFQTNILALNASVEAARAGEDGRGFAVVAAEVRNLAQRAAQAAREIKTLIASSVEGIERGSNEVDEAGRTMQEVVDQIRRVTDVVGEISSASSEQSTGVGQVADAVAQMDQTTQQNAALVEQSAAAAESLRQQAEMLVESVAVFRLRG